MGAAQAAAAAAGIGGAAAGCSVPAVESGGEAERTSPGQSPWGSIGPWVPHYRGTDPAAETATVAKAAAAISRDLQRTCTDS